jgi:hypothetical protein
MIVKNKAVRREFQINLHILSFSAIGPSQLIKTFDVDEELAG